LGNIADLDLGFGRRRNIRFGVVAEVMAGRQPKLIR
jgi:hypothetical protein